MPGLSVTGELGLAEALGWPLKGFRKAFQEVFAKGMAKADWGARVVYLPNAIKYNTPESPNVIRGWLKFFDMIPECDLKLEWVRRVSDYFEREFKPHKGDGEAFREAFREAFADAITEASQKTSSNPQSQPQSQPQKGSAEPEAASTPSGLIMILNDKSEYDVPHKDIERWSDLYRAVDVEDELRKMIAWLEANPIKRKTRRGINRFIVNWLSRQQDKGGTRDSSESSDAWAERRAENAS